MRLMFIALGLVSSLASVGCFPTEKPKLGPDGAPVFQGRSFRHVANTPYFCAAYTSRQGSRVSTCHEDQPSCAAMLDQAKQEGLSILDACEERPETTCITFYRSGRGDTTCYATNEICEREYKESIGEGWQRSQLTACTKLDAAWQPPST